MKINFGTKTWMLPMPVLMIATYGEDGTPDVMNAAWGGTGSEELLTICIDNTHKTWSNIEKRRAFTVSVGVESQVKVCDHLGCVSAKKEPDKVAKIGWTLAKSTHVDAPTINELPLVFECELVSMDLETCLVVGKVVNVAADESVPPDGLRELVINAFAHRNYFDHDAPVFVAVYDTRVEITSPGGLPRGLTVEKAISGCSKIRNKAIAEALSYMRYVEGWGSGLLRVNAELADYGARPVTLEGAGIATRMNVYRITANAPATRHEGNEGNHEDNEGNREGNEGDREGNATERVLAALKRNPKASIIALSKELGISHATIERTEKALQTAGRIRRKGGTRGVWEVLV